MTHVGLSAHVCVCVCVSSFHKMPLYQIEWCWCSEFHSFPRPLFIIISLLYLMILIKYYAVVFFFIELCGKMRNCLIYSFSAAAQDGTLGASGWRPRWTIRAEEWRRYQGCHIWPRMRPWNTCVSSFVCGDAEGSPLVMATYRDENSTWWHKLRCLVKIDWSSSF